MEKKVGILLAFSVFLALITGCSYNSSYGPSLPSFTTSAEYDQFLKENPNTPYLYNLTATRDKLKEEEAFKKAEEECTSQRYREFIQAFPESWLATEANKIVNEPDYQALTRAIRINSIEGYQGFLKAYSGSSYAAEVRSYLNWIQTLSAGVLVTSLAEKVPREEVEKEISPIIKTLEEKFKITCHFLSYESDPLKDRLSILVGITYSNMRPGYKQNISGTVDGAIVGGIAFGPLGAIAGALGGLVGDTIASSIKYTTGKKNYWDLAVSNIAPAKGLELRFHGFFERPGHIAEYEPLAQQIRQTSLLTWIFRSEEAPVGFIQFLLSREDSDFTQTMIRILGMRKNPPIDFLVNCAKSPDVFIQDGAVSALGETRDPRALPPLLTMLKNGPSSYSSLLHLNEAIAKIGPPAVPALLDILEDKMAKDKKNPVIILGIIKDPRAVEALIELLAREQDPDLNAEIMNSLAEITGLDLEQKKEGWLRWWMEKA